MTVQTKRAIDDKVNSLLLGKGSNKRTATGDNNALRALILSNRKEEKRSEDRIPFKVWKMLTPEAKTTLCSGEDVKIWLVKDNAMKTGGPGGGKMYQQHKKSLSKFLRLTQSEGRKNDAVYMRDVNNFIFCWDGPPWEYGGL